LQLDQVLQTLVDVAVEVLEADKSAVFVWDEERERWVMGVAHGFGPEALAKLSFARGEGVVGHVAASGESVFVDDAVSTPLREGERPEAVQVALADGVRSFMHLPIQIDGETFGVFNVSFADTHAFGPEEQRLFLALVQRAALAIENARLYGQAQELAALEERQRLARDLHDAVTQTLFSTSLIAEVLPHIWKQDPDDGRRRLEEIRQGTRSALAEMRALLLELRPAGLVEADLGDLLRQLGEAAAGPSGVSVIVDVEQVCDLPPDVHLALYRIAQEALNNVAKHAGATRAWIDLRCASSLPSSQARQGRRATLLIGDDGRGFDPDDVTADHLGLGIMRERADAVGAALAIESERGRGTEVRVVWVEDDE
jgi:two-component system nitrate/nitrite sensor histidine kinase NarX